MPQNYSLNTHCCENLISQTSELITVSHVTYIHTHACSVRTFTNRGEHISGYILTARTVITLEHTIFLTHYNKTYLKIAVRIATE